MGSGARSTSGVDTVGALLIGGATLISGARTPGVEDSPTGSRPVSFGLAVNGVPGFRGPTADGGRLAGIDKRRVGCADEDEPCGSKASTPQMTATMARVASAAPATITAARVRRGAGPWAPVHRRLRTSPISGRASGCL